MLRTSARDEYLLRINLKKGAVARRFCEVRVKGNDVYVMQPRKGGSVKVSYHQSGQRHLKHGNGRAMFVLQLDRPEWIQKEEPCWESSFENFAHLPAYQGERAESVYDRVASSVNQHNHFRAGKHRAVFRPSSLEERRCKTRDATTTGVPGAHITV
jgi:hypothetical protein